MFCTKSAGIIIEADGLCRLSFVDVCLLFATSVGQVIPVTLSSLNASTDIATKKKTVIISYN